MDVVVRARILGGIGIAAGLGLFLFGRQVEAAAAGFAGLALVLLVTEEGLDPRRAADGALPQARALARMTSSLGLEGRGIVVPRDDGGAYVFLPVRDEEAPALPTIIPDRAFYREVGRAVGAAFEAPGSELGVAWGVDRVAGGAGIEGALATLRAAFPSLGIGREVTLAAAESSIRLTYAPGCYANVCEESRLALHPWSLRGGCPACSFAAIVVARAAGAPVRFRAIGHDGARVILDLEVIAGSTA